MLWKRRWTRRRTADDFTSEVQAHLDIETDRLIAEGLPPDEARAAAHRRFGNATRVRERFYERSRFAWFDQVVVDARSALRSVARYPLAALVAIVSLAAGIGGATTMLLLRDALFRNPPPYYAAPERLSAVRVSTPDRPRGAVPAPLYRHWLDGGGVGGALAAAAPARIADVQMRDRSEPVAIRPATANLFDVLGVTPALGRNFPAAAADGPAPAILSDRVWQSVFGARPDVVGETFLVRGDAYVVIGVLPRQFWFGAMNEPIWTPMDFRSLAPELPLDVVVRRGAGTSPQALAASLQAATEVFTSDRRAGERQMRVVVREMAGTPMGEAMGPIPVVLIGGAVLFTVLIACTNVAILMIAQWTAREHEIAIRASIGADRWRIVRTLVGESLLIALAGAVLGVSVTFALRGLVIYNGGEFTQFNLAVRPMVPIIVTLITIAAGILPGLAPALHETRRSENNPLARLRGSDRVRERWRHAMVVFEVAVTVALLVVVGTIVSATQRALNQDLGFEIAPLLTARVQNQSGVDAAGIVERLSSLPGVTAAAASLSSPMGMTGPERNVTGDTPSPRMTRAELAAIGPGFLTALGVPLLAGRDFLPGEGDGRSRVALVSGELARRVWPGITAPGRALSMDGQTYEVVGVVADYANRTLAPMPPRVFVPLAAEQPTQMQFIVRAEGQPGMLIETVRREVTALSTGNVVQNVIPLQQIVQIGSKEIFATSVPLAPLVIIAMLLSAAGVYGVLAFTVARRSTELAVRVAVGADRGDLVRLVALRSLRVIGLGLLVGVGATFAITRLAQGGGGIFDSPGWQAFVVPMAIVTVIGALATWIPARRAVRTDAAQLLRST